MQVKNHILKIFIIASFLLSCKDSDYVEQVNSYPETKVADNWTLRLPFGLREIELKHIFYQRIFDSPNNSTTLGVRAINFSVEDGLKQFSNIVENEKHGKVDGICMTGFKGNYTNYNFIDSVNMLSGVITDREENGVWGVDFNVVSAKTGNALMLGFDKLSFKEVKLMHEVLKSTRNHR